MLQRFLVLSAVLVFSLNVFGQRPVRDIEESLILISIDGFRADYLDIHEPTTLRKLAKNGVRAKWLTPSFPTKTFPNHYTIATGLYPAKHGIIANNIYDPATKAKFTLGNREEVQNPRWWGGEPIWVTAEKSGMIAGAFFFPGTESKIKGISPTYWQQYDGKVPNEVRVDSILSWFDYPKEKRPRLMTLYFSDVDDAGHRYSPESKETKKAVRYVDKLIKRLVDGLKKRKIDKKVNLVIVSDHGMTASPGKNNVVIDKLFDQDDAEEVIWVGEFTQIFPKAGKEQTIYTSLKKGLPEQFEVFLKKDIPARFEYRDNPKIAPIVVIPKPGWHTITTSRLERNRTQGRLENTGGRHGYDNAAESMKALFIGSGPGFKRGYVSEPFRNVEIYNLMCKILGLTPAENDGDIKNVEDLLR